MVIQLQGKAGLLRQLGFVSATALVVSNMVGMGIFATTGFMARDLGSAPLILAVWLVGALFALAGALSYSELGINFPSSGGEYVYLTRAFGPAWGFMTGWVSFFAGFSAPIAAASLAFSDYLGYFYPSLQQARAPYVIGSGPFSIRLGGGQAVACLLIAGFSILNCLGVRRTARVQNVLTATKLTVIIGFIGLGFLSGSGSWQHFSQPAVRTAPTSLPAQFVISLLWVMVAYSGWNAATYVAEELKRPERTLPAALAASNLFGPQVAGTFSALMALSLMATVNAEVTIGPRVYYAMAKNKAFFKDAAKVHPGWHTPVVAILSQGLCAMLMTLTPFPQLVYYIGFSLTFFSVMSVASLFIFRRRPGWQTLRPVSFCFPAIPLSYILVGACMITYGIVWQPMASLTALATIGAGAAVYHVWLRPRDADRTQS